MKKRQTACRPAQSYKWNTLPQHLMDPIIKQVEVQCGLSGILLMRQVSKSWLAAIGDYPTAARCSVYDTTQLAILCKMMPGMSSLEIQCDSLGYLKLKSLARLLHLTRLSLYGIPYHSEEPAKLQPLVKLNHLPATLQILGMNGIYADRHSFGAIECPGLTRLIFYWHSNKSTDAQELVERFPNLKVLPFEDLPI